MGKDTEVDPIIEPLTWDRPFTFSSSCMFSVLKSQSSCSKYESVGTSSSSFLLKSLMYPVSDSLIIIAVVVCGVDIVTEPCATFEDETKF